jgi:hypothetical protein
LETGLFASPSHTRQKIHLLILQKL